MENNILNDIISNILKIGNTPIYKELKYKCPKCDEGLLSCFLHDEYILFICGKYNCGYHCSYSYKELISKISRDFKII